MASYSDAKNAWRDVVHICVYKAGRFLLQGIETCRYCFWPAMLPCALRTSRKEMAQGGSPSMATPSRTRTSRQFPTHPTAASSNCQLPLLYPSTHHLVITVSHPASATGAAPSRHERCRAAVSWSGEARQRGDFVHGQLRA